MEEKTIIKGELKNFKPFCVVLPLIGIFVFLVVDLIVALNMYSYYNSTRYYADSATSLAFEYAFGKGNGCNLFFVPIIGALAIVGIILYIRWRKVQITVTDKRVFGNAVGKRVDLPLDSITAVGTSLFSGLSVSTSSGTIKFAMLKNRDELHEAVSKLLIERQNNAVRTTTLNRESAQSNADELKKYKDLFESGVITQEEFDAKKKQLLDL